MSNLLRRCWRTFLAAGFVAVCSGAQAAPYSLTINGVPTINCQATTFTFSGGATFQWNLASASSQVRLTRVVNGVPFGTATEFSPGSTTGSVALSLLGQGGTAPSYPAQSFPYTLEYSFEGLDYNTDGVRLSWTCTAAGNGTGTGFTTSVIPGTPPPLSVSPASVNFPSTSVGSVTAATNVTVTNTSGGSLSGVSVSSNNSADFDITNNCGNSLANGATCTVSVAFSPNSSGLRSGTITVASNSGNATVSLVGSATAQLAFSPSSLNFPGTAVGATSAPLAINVTNNGATPVTVSGVTSSTADFAATTSCTTIAPAGTCAINVTFSPTSTGLKSSIVTFTSSAAGSPNTFTMLGNGTSGPVSGTLTVPAQVAFGTQNVGASSSPSTVTLTNASGAAVTVSSIASSAPGEFAVSANTCTTVAAGGTCSFAVTFTPSATGARTASITVTSNGTGSPQIVAASGTGASAPVQGQLTFPSTLALGPHLIGTTSGPQTVTVTNSGGTAVTISSITSSAPAEFAVSAPGCTTVAPAGTCSIAVTFTPAAAGDRSAVVTVTSDGLGSPQSFTATGIGVTPSSPGQLSMVAAIDAGAFMVGLTSPPASITITNIGGTTVNVSSITSSNSAEFAIVQNTCAAVTPGASCSVAFTFLPAAVGARASTFTVTSDGVGSPQVIAVSGTGTDTATTIELIEYYHAAFDHYFITGIPDEISKLDAGVFQGWARTGLKFKAYPVDTPNASNVCRFFSTSFDPKSSHFYTPFTTECDIVKQNKDWTFEGLVFAMPIPQLNGACAVGTVPVYRLYNDGQGAAPNHRYTTDLAVRAQMIGKGWIPEGYGDVGVIMCSPL